MQPAQHHALTPLERASYANWERLRVKTAKYDTAPTNDKEQRKLHWQAIDKLQALDALAIERAGLCLVSVERELCAYLVTFDDGKTLLLQTDWDIAAFCENCGLIDSENPSATSDCNCEEFREFGDCDCEERPRVYVDCDPTDIWYCPSDYWEQAE